MDDGVQRVKVQGTTCRRTNIMKEYTMERKYSGKSTGGERLGSVGTQSHEWKQTGH